MTKNRYSNRNSNKEQRERELRRRRRIQKQKYLRRKRRIRILKIVFFFALCFWGYRFIHAEWSQDDNVKKVLDTQQTEQQNFAEETKISSVNKGKLIVIDAGHGGNDPGCNTRQYYEKDIVLSVAKLLEKELQARGFTVKQTRTEDEYLGLSERADIANQLNADAFISVHCNAFEFDTSISGTDCYYYKSEEGAKMAQSITDAFRDSSIESRETKEENFEVLRETNMLGVLVEVGFLSNPSELDKMIDKNYQTKLASAIADGIDDYYTEQ